MLTIRPTQMDTLREKLDADYHQRLADHLRKTYPAAREMENEKLTELVSAAVERARKHDITSERSIAFFASYFFEIQPDFDLQPPTASWVQLLLTATDMDPDARLRKIYREARKRRQLAPQPEE